MENAKVLFESYNVAVEESYNEIIMSSKSPELVNIEDERIIKKHEENLEHWANTPNENIGGISPKEYFEAIDELDSIIKLFIIAAKLSDTDIPGVLLDRLQTFNEDAVNKLLNMACDDKCLCDEDEMIVSLMAIRALGKWKSVYSLESLIKLLFDIDQSNEIVIEEILYAMIQMGESAAKRIIEILDESASVGSLEEYLLDTLVKIGVSIKDTSLYDLIFRSIKSTFNKMENKLFGAICLGNFGDGRAITVLRSFVEKNKNNIDYETFLEIKSSIHRLGGNVDDIDIQF